MTNPIVDPLVEGVDTSPTSDLVRIEATVEGAVTVLLNRPARRNAFDADLISALEEAFRTIAGAEGVRVVFLRGAGGTFCAGGDVEWMRQAADRAEDENREDAFALARMLKELWDLPQLTVALVEGAAFGGGAGLAAACDLAVATADARFAFTEVRLGLVPGTIAPYVVNAIGPRRARALFATGRAFDAAQAERIGLVTEVVADAAALDAAHDRIAEDILACAPGAVADAKRMVAEVAGREIDHGLMDLTARRIAAARAGEEGQEGVRAFLEHRRPSWAADGGAPG
ncbi:enoyl-CoA hydratase-related protein [Phenylobacterium sp. LjRoot225]|uniref:enoyl-CoA hydratase-related protein n=1 Tax=Phenylobacterium sp. LjRoot225 TaxID=3342285 RepID=UPI003ECC730D